MESLEHLLGQRVRFAWNLHRLDFSLRSQGKVLGYSNGAVLRDVRFIVLPAGRQRVLATGRKDVHAFVEGVLVDLRAPTDPTMRSAYYNPRKVETWVDGDTPLHTAEEAHLYFTLIEGRRCPRVVYR